MSAVWILAQEFGQPFTLIVTGASKPGPDDVVAAADARLVIPIAPGLRSLNVAMAAAMALGEALRQTKSIGNG
jgi:tRNA (cytidine/uridine-2'-O-)-methyltransferase